MDKKILQYLCPTFAQIILVSLITLILKSSGHVCGYKSVLGIILIIAGGVSSALWGCFFQIRYGNKTIKMIIKIFFASKLS